MAVKGLSITNFATLGALILTIVGLIFTAIQVRNNTITQRGMLFKDVYETFLTDPELNFVFELIEQRAPIFDGRYGASDEDKSKRNQAAVERLFTRFEVICSLYRRGLFTDEDMRDFDYIIERVAKHPGFFDYEAFLANWAHRKQVQRSPYKNVFWYVRTNLDLAPK